MKLVFVSYHYHPHEGYRSSLLHNYFRKLRQNSSSLIQEYIFLHANWDHQSKSVLRYSKFEQNQIFNEIIQVPPYYKNLSLRRVWSHLVFSWKVFVSPSLKNADLVYICVPPSLSGLGPALKMMKAKKPWIIDLVDLWPEALPASRSKKCVLNITIGWLWKFLRNNFYSRATKLVSHCQYFLNSLPLKSTKTHFIPLALPASESFDFKNKAEKAPITTEFRFLVLGSINHVLDVVSLVNILTNLSKKIKEIESSQNIILEIIGAGERKHFLIEQLGLNCSQLKVIDHGMTFDSKLKHEVMSRCHFGYNGYINQTAIGITYKSIDFSSHGLVFVNSVQGDLRDLVKSYNAGFNYIPNLEHELVQEILELKQDTFNQMMIGSRKMFDDLFRYEVFEDRMNDLIESVMVPKK